MLSPVECSVKVTVISAVNIRFAVCIVGVIMAGMENQWYTTGGDNGMWQNSGPEVEQWQSTGVEGETWLNPGADSGPWLNPATEGGPWLNPNQQSGTFLDPPEEDEPPLLEELGVDPALTLRRAVGVWRKDSAVVLGLGGTGDPDLAGPAAVALAVAAVGLATGRANAVYLVSLAGLLLVWYLAGALGERPPALVDVASALGYCLQPVAALAAARLLPDPLGLANSLPSFVAPLTATAAAAIGAFAASRALADASQARSARALIAYPCALVYIALALLAAF